MFAKKHPTFHYLVPQASSSLMLRLGTLKPGLGGKNHLFPYMPPQPPGGAAPHQHAFTTEVFKEKGAPLSSWEKCEVHIQVEPLELPSC